MLNERTPLYKPAGITLAAERWDIIAVGAMLGFLVGMIEMGYSAYYYRLYTPTMPGIVWCLDNIAQMAVVVLIGAIAGNILFDTKKMMERCNRPRAALALFLACGAFAMFASGYCGAYWGNYYS